MVISRRGKRLLRAIVTAAVALGAALAVRCASTSYGYRINEEYRHTSFNGEEFSHRSVLVLPVLRADTLLSVPLLQPSRQRRWFEKNRRDLTIVPFAGFIDSVAARGDSVAWHHFTSDLFREDVIALQSSDSIWAAMGADYCFVTRLTNTAKIIGFDASVKRRFTLEGEMWRTSPPSCVWRINVANADIDGTLSDAQLMWAMIQKMYEQLPPWVPGKNETDW